VPLGSVVIDELAAHLAAYPSDGPLFTTTTTTTGEPLGYVTWASTWARVGKAVSLDGDTHALRHFYASALIAGGASVKVVQARLGHGSAVVTLNTYGHLWPGDDDLTRTVMDAACGILADSLRTSAAAEG
jgi:integrase